MSTSEQGQRVWQCSHMSARGKSKFPVLMKKIRHPSPLIVSQLQSLPCCRSHTAALTSLNYIYLLCSPLPRMLFLVHFHSWFPPGLPCLKFHLLFSLSFLPHSRASPVSCWWYLLSNTLYNWFPGYGCLQRGFDLFILTLQDYARSSPKYDNYWTDDK